jgi:IS30 family transposase
LSYRRLDQFTHSRQVQCISDQREPNKQRLTEKLNHWPAPGSEDTDSVVSALVRQVKQLPAGLMSSLTWDRETEFADHKRFSIATDVSVYFCDPQSPWQRGSNENTNGLLRQYFPKGADLSGYSQRNLNAVARQLNTRPRKT